MHDTIGYLDIDKGHANFSKTVSCLWVVLLENIYDIQYSWFLKLSLSSVLFPSSLPFFRQMLTEHLPCVRQTGRFWDVPEKGGRHIYLLCSVGFAYWWGRQTNLWYVRRGAVGTERVWVWVREWKVMAWGWSEEASLEKVVIAAQLMPEPGGGNVSTNRLVDLTVWAWLCPFLVVSIHFLYLSLFVFLRQRSWSGIWNTTTYEEPSPVSCLCFEGN